ncbi:putative inactive serine/threonine-protein kinase scy1 [Trifolium repens]|nr:putative inactive serine/threonine-protein kinase scy1 [Trifolium repens]
MHAPTSPTSTDGWGELENGIDEEPENDKDGWDDLEPLEETKPTPVLTNIQAAQRRTVSHAKAPILQPKSTPKLSMDEDDDLWGALATPAPKTSKPLNLKSTATDDDDPWAASHCSSCTHYKGQALISWKRSGSQTRCSKIRCSAD